MADLPNDVIVLAFYRLAILLIVLAVGFAVRQHHHWPVGVAAVTGIASNVAFLAGDLKWAGYLSIPYIGAMGWLFIEYMRHDPVAMRALLLSKESVWSKERHDLKNDLASAQAQLFVCRERLGSTSEDQ